MGLRRLLGMRPRARRRATTDIDAMIADGDLDRAEGHLRAKILVHPNNLGNRVKLAALIARNKRPSMAAIEYMAIAEVHAADDAYDPAIRLVERALTLMPGNLDMTTRLVQLERLRQAASKRSVIFDYLEHGKRPPGSTRRLSSSRLVEFWPKIVPSALVQDLPAEQLGALFWASEPIQLSHRTAVMRQGQIIARAHVIVSGAIEAAVPGPDGRQIKLQILEPGEIFGEASLLDNAECPANYFAIGDNTTVLRMTKRALDGLLASELGAKDLVAAFRRLCSDGKVYALAHAPAEH